MVFFSCFCFLLRLLKSVKFLSAWDRNYLIFTVSHYQVNRFKALKRFIYQHIVYINKKPKTLWMRAHLTIIEKKDKKKRTEKLEWNEWQREKEIKSSFISFPRSIICPCFCLLSIGKIKRWRWLFYFFFTPFDTVRAHQIDLSLFPLENDNDDDESDFVFSLAIMLTKNHSS